MTPAKLSSVMVVWIGSGRFIPGLLANQTINDWFNVTAFAIPALYTYGNAGRNILYGPGFVNWDALAMRNFQIRERLRLQFRGEFFNFTNTPAFNNPVINIQASNAGHITSAGSPRDIQLGLKLLF
ncbi:MAG TPA: hypothetical protein VKV15_04610 [Bryobacteraceae bacterium]|nr:hypothetical protein [Bryobacteraceae bacterium]